VFSLSRQTARIITRNATKASLYTFTNSQLTNLPFHNSSPIKKSKWRYINWGDEQDTKAAVACFKTANKKTLKQFSEKWVSGFNQNIAYCHVSGVPWRIITGSGLDDWIYWRLVLQSITTAHNEWLPKMRSIPYWTTRVFYCDWLGSDLRIGHFPYESLTKNHTSLLICEWITSEWISLSFTLRPTVCLGIKHPSGAYDQIFITVRQLGICWCGALPLTRVRSAVYNCFWPSPAQSFSSPSPVGLVNIFYCLRFETSLFIASYDSQGYGGGIRTRLHKGSSSLHGRLYSLVAIRWHGNLCWIFVYMETRFVLSRCLGIHLHGNMC
jgi:hypothetical protein